MSSTNDVFVFDVDGSDSADFTLRGGVYMVTLAGSWGTVTLNVLAADGATWLPFQTWSGDAAATMTLVAGSYQLAYDSFTGTMGIAQQPPSPDWVLQSLSQPRPISSSGGVTTVTTLGSDTELDLVSSGNDGGHEGTWVYTRDMTGSTNSSDAGIGTGTAVDGTSGITYVYTGNTSGSGTSGNVEIGSGNSSGGDSGDIRLETGTADGTRGNIILDALITQITNGQLQAPAGVEFDIASPSNGGSSNTGMVFVFSGDQTGTGQSGSVGLQSGNATGGNSGPCFVGTGNSSGENSAQTTIFTGDAHTTGDVLIGPGTASAGNSGNIELRLAASTGGTKGNVILTGIPTVDPHVAGAVWNSSGNLKISAG